MRGGKEYIRFIEDIWRLEWVSPRQSSVNICEYIFLASGFPGSVRVFIASLPGLSGLHLTQEPLICFKSLAHALGATTWGLPNPHWRGFTETLKMLSVLCGYNF